MTIIVTTTASAAARDYTWLLGAIAAWSGNRSDLASLTPDFVMLAEKQLNKDLEARLQDSVTTLTTVAGQSTVAIPSDVSDMHSLSIPNQGPLEYVTPDMLNKLYPVGATGSPRLYTIIGQSIYFGPIPDAVIGISCAYRAFIPPLSDSAGTNWLIEKYPNCYLAASMIQAIAYTKNFDDLPIWEKKYADAIESVNGPDWFNGSNMRVRSDVRN